MARPRWLTADIREHVAPFEAEIGVLTVNQFLARRALERIDALVADPLEILAVRLARARSGQ